MPLQLVPFGRLTFTANRVRRSRKGVLSGVATSGVESGAPKGLPYRAPRHVLAPYSYSNLSYSLGPLLANTVFHDLPAMAGHAAVMTSAFAVIDSLDASKE